MYLCIGAFGKSTQKILVEKIEFQHSGITQIRVKRLKRKCTKVGRYWKVDKSPFTTRMGIRTTHFLRQWFSFFGWLIIRNLFEFVCYNYNLLSIFIPVHLSSINIKTKLLKSAFFSLLKWTNFVFGFDVKTLASYRKTCVHQIDCFIRLLINRPRKT